MEDKRFGHISKDPKFRRIPKSQNKIKIDDRFNSMFTEKKFQVKYTVDKRGRPVKHHSTDDLKRYYEVSSDEQSLSEEQSDNEAEPGKYVKAPVHEESDSENDGKSDENQDQLNSVQKTDKKISEDVKLKLRDLNIDYARGENNLCSESSSDDEESDDELSESEEIDHMWGELDADAGRTEEGTNRLAVCNLDWDRIRAIDLMMLFNSFLPPGGVIHSVAIYPSEFGKQRMNEEEIKGPIELMDAKKDDRDNENEEGSKFRMEKLRQYQLNRLKYYYAVIVFDSVSSADKVYTECDGMEYECSATKIDLRFIPENTTFDDDPKEIIDKLPEKYEPRFFTTTALQQAKVDLTWDETNPDRLEFTEKLNTGKLEDISENTLQNFLAGSSSEEEDADSQSSDEGDILQSGKSIDKYKALLEDIQEKEDEKKNKKYDMEISWDVDAKEKTDKIIKESIADSQEKTPFQKYLDKKKEKRKEKRQLKNRSQEKNQSDDSDVPTDIDMSNPYFAEEFNNSEFKKKLNSKKHKKKDIPENEDKQKQSELALLLTNSEDNNKKHFSLKKIQDNENESKTKKKKYKKAKDSNAPKEEDDFEVNVEDKRFSALFTSHHFNIDPTDPHYKKTKSMDKLVEAKIKRRNEEEVVSSPKHIKIDNSKRKNIELKLLVNNIKRKTESYKNK